LKTAYALAETQHGVLARYQLVAKLGRVAAEDVLATDRFARLETGVYRVRGGARLPYQAAFAAALRARPKAVVTGPVALGLHAVPGWVGATDFEVLVAPGRRLRAAAFPVRTASSRLQGNLRFGDVRVAGAVDALIASAALRGERDERDLRVAWDHIRWNGLGRPALLDRRLGELSDTEGARLLSAVLDASGGTRVEGEGERRLAPVLGCFEPAFEPQVWVTPRRRVDFFSHRCRFGVEYLGRVDHGTVAARLADDERDRELRREGIRLSYVTARDLDDPTALLATLSGALTVRAHELGVQPPVAVRPVAGTID
jgi:hypothetical protein